MSIRYPPVLGSSSRILTYIPASGSLSTRPVLLIGIIRFQLPYGDVGIYLLTNGLRNIIAFHFSPNLIIITRQCPKQIYNLMEVVFMSWLARERIGLKELRWGGSVFCREED